MEQSWCHLGRQCSGIYEYQNAAAAGRTRHDYSKVSEAFYRSCLTFGRREEVTMGYLWITLLLLVAAAEDVSACPNGCTCDEVTVICNEKGLTKVPTGIPAATTYLNLGNNRIKKIEASDFRNLNNLQHLYLDSNDITQIDPEAFRGLSRLTTLQLMNNGLITVSQRLFDHTPSLRTVSLKGNPWSCDCRIRWLWEWVYSKQDLDAPEMPQCDYPYDLDGIYWDQLTADNFTCDGSEVDPTDNGGTDKDSSSGTFPFMLPVILGSCLGFAVLMILTLVLVICLRKKRLPTPPEQRNDLTIANKHAGDSPVKKVNANGKIKGGKHKDKKKDKDHPGRKSSEELHVTTRPIDVNEETVSGKSPRDKDSALNGEGPPSHYNQQNYCGRPDCKIWFTEHVHLDEGEGTTTQQQPPEQKQRVSPRPKSEAYYVNLKPASPSEPFLPMTDADVTVPGDDGMPMKRLDVKGLHFPTLNYYPPAKNGVAQDLNVNPGSQQEGQAYQPLLKTAGPNPDYQHLVREQARRQNMNRMKQAPRVDVRKVDSNLRGDYQGHYQQGARPKEAGRGYEQLQSNMNSGYSSRGSMDRLGGINVQTTL
ncbi:PREDICTED: uncharacterized protein LOC109471919 isoform X1 [Branchiostoma belcheri]|uniref:Uncharacterized protein LOC109471919 isoform X1 n=2 Tax=Branchiostoma belcheri TaxID=7741 RepID=A0A6P4ZB88_BRABE|nr:PREDICTED: uncharacterized protein LOC109471919 isoform X1 [Branchiostoma belcheri]